MVRPPNRLLRKDGKRAVEVLDSQMVQGPPVPARDCNRLSSHAGEF